jgi:hypothetical protein
MKTTLDLPDVILTRAKMLAIRRHTTLKALVEHALMREIEGAGTSDHDELIEEGPHGIPRLKREGRPFITTAMIRELMDEEGV